ncbi:TIGR03960 family B12-binding radical SAM protein [bacterium]|nr:TIGR03960 family B12-binding radical SAM protein [bacterium]
MRTLLEHSFFPFVIKPGRYAGGEIGQIVKDPEGRTKYLHAYPDKYELGQSYVGLQTLYHLVNEDDRFLCERVFAVDVDAESVMREKNIPLFALESSRPARDFDAIGFTLVDEIVSTNVLAMLDLAGLPLRSVQRTDEHPIVMAGGPGVFAPEPLAPFIDLFFIGDGEIGLPQMLGILHEMKGAPRREKLERICREVEGVYIPAFYDEQRKQIVDFAPERVTARLVSELKQEYYPRQPLVPLVEIAHEHLGIEIMRGCPQGCRFCMAGPIYKPVRPRPINDIMQQVQQQLDATGYSEVTLLSLSSSDYPEIEELATRMSKRLETYGASLSLPSLRPGTISPRLLEAVNRVRTSNLTIAPEAGTERLRLFIRKDFPDQAILDTVKMAFDKGINSIKLYFMVGLPTETQEDLLGIVELCRTIHGIARDFSGKRNITVTLSPFVPKPHTPFQWDEALPEKELFERIQFVRRKMRTSHTTIRHNSTILAQLTAIISRGDRSMADTIEAAFRKGCRFDAWSEHFQWEKWQEAFAETGVDIEASLRAIGFDRALPWDHIHKGPSKDHLREERQRTSLKLKEYVPFDDAETTSQYETDPNAAFGRGKKKLAARTLVQPTKSKVRIRWGRTERFKYMSHLDTLRMIERSIRRARIPVAYSQGFNPTMKLSFGPPLTVGYTSEAELVEITMDQAFSAPTLEQLRRAMPPGIEMFEARVIHAKSASLSSILNRARYTIDLSHWSDIEALRAQAEGLLAKESVISRRKGKDSEKEVDIRPPIYELTVGDSQLAMLLGIGEGGYVRPNEVLEQLREGLAVPPEGVTCHRAGLYRVVDEETMVDGMQA